MIQNLAEAHPPYLMPSQKFQNDQRKLLLLKHITMVLRISVNKDAISNEKME